MNTLFLTLLAFVLGAIGGVIFDRMWLIKKVPPTS